MDKAVSISEFNAFAFMQVDALDSIDKRFGPYSPKPLSYHFVGHTLDVMRHTSAIGKKAGVEPWQLLLLVMGGLYHDYFQEFGSGRNEELSARAARTAMRGAGFFNAADEEFVTEVIIGTKCKVEDDGIIQQAAGMSIYAMMLADGDLAAIGELPEIYWPVTIGLHAEQKPGIKLEGEELENLARTQIRILKKHRFLTPWARELLPHQQDNIDFLERDILNIRH